ncbi:hypothetical protein SARC_16260, partial [Sphaeroforma arctica JP610]
MPATTANGVDIQSEPTTTAKMNNSESTTSNTDTQAPADAQESAKATEDNKEAVQPSMQNTLDELSFFLTNANSQLRALACTNM